MDFVTLAGMLELEARAQRELARRRAFRDRRERHELGERRGGHDGHDAYRQDDSIAHGHLLYLIGSWLIWNWTGSRTHMATGSLPRRAGSKRHRRTASMAAWSRSG